MIEKGRVISLISSAAGLCGSVCDRSLCKKQSDQTDLRYRGTCAFCGHIYDAGSTCTHMPAQQYALSGQA